MTMPNGLPETREVFIGLKRSTWPIQIFEEETHAIAWLDSRDANESAGDRHLYRGVLVITEEQSLLKAKPRLVPLGKERPDA